MSDMRFTEDHEWILIDGDVGTVGITDYAQTQLGDVVFVELPELGRQIEKGGEVAVVESVKAASEIYAPVAGEVVAVNAALADKPMLVNQDATGAGWFLKLRISDAGDIAGLMNDAAYKRFIEGLA